MVQQASSTGCERDFSDFSFIFIGSTHGYWNDFEIQKKIVDRVQPDLVLAEQMQDLEINNKKEFSEFMSKYGKNADFAEVMPLVKYCSKKKMALKGIDIPNFGLFRGIGEEELKKVVKKRQKMHIEKIKKYASRPKKPVIVCVGAWHLLPGSPLLKKFSNYVVMRPCDDKGNFLREPPNKQLPPRYCCGEK